MTKPSIGISSEEIQIYIEDKQEPSLLNRKTKSILLVGYMASNLSPTSHIFKSLPFLILHEKWTVKCVSSTK